MGAFMESIGAHQARQRSSGMTRILLIGTALIQLGYWLPDLQDLWTPGPILDRMVVLAFLIAASMTLVTQARGRITGIPRIGCFGAHLFSLGLVTSLFALSDNPAIFMVFAMPMGSLIFGPPLVSIILLGASPKREGNALNNR